jgi:hypothetical protein
MEGVIEREHPHDVVFGYRQDDEAVIQPDVIPLQPQDLLRLPSGTPGVQMKLSTKL